MYTGIVPYLYGVLLRLKCRQGFQRVEVEEPYGLINRRFKDVGIAVMISRRWKNTRSGASGV